jgi:hypothetical protein
MYGAGLDPAAAAAVFGLFTTPTIAAGFSEHRLFCDLAVRLAQLDIEQLAMLVTIVTPTTGNPLLRQALQSVQDQDYANIEHLLVIDGAEREPAVRALMDDMIRGGLVVRKRVHVLCLPYATGKDRFNGHRIYGMAPFLINGDWMSMLDEDNWFDRDHVSSLVETVRAGNLDWAYSLRKIVDPQGRFLVNDDCESLGQWKEHTNRAHHVDTSCYLLRRDLAVAHAPLWYRRFREQGLPSPDMALCNQLVNTFPKCATNGLYSMNYRLGSSALSVGADFFERGNATMRERYGDPPPWRRAG